MVNKAGNDCQEEGSRLCHGINTFTTTSTSNFNTSNNKKQNLITTAKITTLSITIARAETIAIAD